MSEFGRSEGTNELYLAAAKRFEALFDGIPVACLTFDEQGNVYEWNRSATHLLETTPDQALQQPISLLFNQPDSQVFQRIVRDVFRGVRVEEIEMMIPFTEGRVKHVLLSAFPLQSIDGTITGAVMSAQDITARKQLQDKVESQLLELSEAHTTLFHQRDELARANEKLEELATTDGLTGIRNRRSFQKFIEQQFHITRRSCAELSLLIVDVDHFKMYNDVYGHPAGDEVLRSVAGALATSARISDYVARYGGEEFVLVLPDTDEQGSIDAAERFRMAIANTPMAHRPVTASVGAATLRPSDKSYEELVSRADEALYASKHAGRNCVTHFDLMQKAA